MALTAGEIDYNIKTKILSAQGIAVDSGKSIQMRYCGKAMKYLMAKKMTYNLNTTKAR